MKKQGRSIFHTIFLAMLSVLFIETLLLLIVLYLSRVGERLNQNAIDLLQKQVENRSSYLESVMLDNQNLSSLSDKINTAAESLRESGLIDMEHLGDNSNACLPLMEAIDSDLIEELRSHSATGLFVLFNTQDLSRREIHSDIPCIYLRDLTQMLRRLTGMQICFCSVPRPPWSNPWEFPPTVPGPLPFPTAGLVPPVSSIRPFRRHMRIMRSCLPLITDTGPSPAIR